MTGRVRPGHVNTQDALPAERVPEIYPGRCGRLVRIKAGHDPQDVVHPNATIVHRT